MFRFRFLLSFCLLITLSILFTGCGDREASNPLETSDADSENERLDPDTLPLPQYSTGLCRIYGGHPEAWVLVDGQPALNEQNEHLSPPCEVRVERGSRSITLIREGYQDLQREVLVSETAELTFPEMKESESFSIVTMDAPLFTWPIGRPFPLSQINTVGAELDPFLSHDGLTLWFAGDRDDGKAIYSASRLSIWHDFEEPEVLLLSRGSELPASPSVTQDQLFLYYTQPESSRIVSLTRKGPLDKFGDQKKVLFDQEMKSQWMTAQVLPDHLRLYWTTLNGEMVEGFASVRKNTLVDFSRPIPYPLPGYVPVLSSDGLRQYQFDGETLSRSRRVEISDSFSSPETLHELQLSGYSAQSHRRQFDISENEQWMVYSAGDVETADLYLVRISESVGWGVVPRGKSIPPKPEPQEVVDRGNDPKSMDRPMEKKPEIPTVDPRSLPLPFSEYLVKWEEAMSQRDFDAALKLAEQGLDDPVLRSSRQMLNQDYTLTERIASIWSLVDAALKELKPNAKVTLGSTRAEFLDYAGTTVTFQVGSKEVKQELEALPASTITSLLQDFLESDDEQRWMTLAYFLLYDADSTPEFALNRVTAFPESARKLVAEQYRHELHRVELEFERQNYSAGVVILRSIVETSPESAAANTARQLEEQLYELTQWTEIGNRKWIMDRSKGQYEAQPDRVENSYLRSPKSLRAFELQFEWKTEGPVGQGGIYFHYKGEGPVFNNAYKIHLAGDYAEPPDQYSSGSLFGLEAPSKNNVKRKDEWNDARLIVRGNSIMFILNGETVLETFALSEELPEEGFLLLDGVTGGITYRKVLLTELP